MMKAQLLIAAGIILFSTIGYSQTNINLSNASLFNGEPYIAVNPTNNQNIVTAWMGLVFVNGQFRQSVKIKYSIDGGNNWPAITALPNMGTGFKSADVSMAFSKNGTLFLSYIDHTESPDSGGVYVTKSTNGGITWSPSIKVIDMYADGLKKPIDRPWLVIDNSNTSNSGTLYITTKPAPWVALPNRNYYTSSSDNGSTWTPVANVDGGNYLIGSAVAGPMAAPAVTSNGKFCAVYPSYVAGQNVYPAFLMASSYNKGLLFNYNTVYAAPPTSTNANLKVSYKLVANPKDSNQLVFLFVNGKNGDADIMACNSADGGSTWSAPQRVNDDAIANGKDQDMVWAAYNATGKLAITWRDRRDANTTGFWNAGYDFYYAISADNGQTFSTNKKISSQFVPFDSIIAQSGNDMMSCDFVNDTLYTAWGDTRTGKLNIFFNKTITNIGISISSINLNDDIQIFPNPANDYINIPNASNQQIIVFDMLGTQIGTYHSVEINYKMDIRNYASGIYYATVNNKIYKFTKQ